MATLVTGNVATFYRLLLSDYLKVVGDGAVINATRIHKTREMTLVNNSEKEQMGMDGSIDTVIISAATEKVVEKIRDITYLNKDNLRNEGLSKFHPISKNMNKIVTSFVSSEVIDEFENVTENQDYPQKVSRQQRQFAGEENGNSL